MESDGVMEPIRFDADDWQPECYLIRFSDGTVVEVCKK
jgi:hypothetical protein